MDRVWHATFLHKFKFYGVSDQIFGLISCFLSKRQLWVVPDEKSLQEYQLNAGVSQGSTLGSRLFYYTLMTFVMMLPVIFLSMLMILLSTISVIRHLICGNDYIRLLNLNLNYKTLWTGARSGLLISILEKLNWLRLTDLITLVLLIWKIIF